MACHHAATTTLGHTGERLADLGVTKARLAEAKIRHLQTTALVDAVTSGFASSNVDHLSLLAVKAAAAEMSIDVTDAAIRVCDGAAFSKHLPVEWFFRDARAATIMGPTTDVLRHLIGQAITTEAQ